MLIDHTYFLIVVVLLTVGTILIRGSFISLAGKMVINHRLKDLFTYIPAAILPALIIPATYFHQGKVESLMGKERFVIVLAALILGHFVRNTLAIVSFGLIALYLVSTFY